MIIVRKGEEDAFNSYMNNKFTQQKTNTQAEGKEKWRP